MIYIRNCSHKIIHLGEVMLLPDEKVPDLMPNDDKKYSDTAVIKQFLRMGILELVDVRPVESAPDAPTIKVEYEDIPDAEIPEIPASAPDEAPERMDEAEGSVAETEEPKMTAPTQSQTRRRKTQQSKG